MKSSLFAFTLVLLTLAVQNSYQSTPEEEQAEEVVKDPGEAAEKGKPESLKHASIKYTMHHIRPAVVGHFDLRAEKLIADAIKKAREENKNKQPGHFAAEIAPPVQAAIHALHAGHAAEKLEKEAEKVKKEHKPFKGSKQGAESSGKGGAAVEPAESEE